MALPQFVQGDMVVELSREPAFPDVRPLVLNQFVGVSDANTFYVASVGTPVRTILLNFQQLTYDDREQLEAFFANETVNYGQFPFTYIDHNTTSHTVRYLEPQFALPAISHNNVSFEMVLTVVA